MKTVIISDVHLNHHFDERKFLFLKELISSCDRIILNGDFWDGYRTTFEIFLASRWKQLFPLLIKKNALYIYGNHDQKKYSNKKVSLFSVEQKDSYEITVNKITYHIEHGHLLAHSIDIEYPFLPHLFFYVENNIAQRLECIFTYINSPHNMLLRYINSRTKKKLRAMIFPNWYLCGHTHYAEIDKKNKFANSGFIQFGKATYLIVDSFGLSLHTKRY